MKKNTSTKDLGLSSNERLFLKNKSIFMPKKYINLKPYGLKIYTFNAGFKKKFEDLLILIFDQPVNSKIVYSKTSTPSAPIIWDKKHNNGSVKALIVNSGNANAHTGDKGLKNIDKYVSNLSKLLNCKKNEILVSSTGVIGQELNPNLIINQISRITKKQSGDLLDAAKSIMTTDTFPKILVKNVKINKKKFKIYGIAKGSGMIYPNMATTLGYIFTDATLSSSVLNEVLKNNIKTTFNAISCDGDTSTNDMVSIFSTSKVNHSEIKKYSDSKLKNFNKAVHDVLLNLAKQVVSDGEGASKFISINCINCRTEKDAKNISFKIANSLLVKTAIAGEDPNWGRVAMAIGNSDSKINEQKLSISFGPYKIYHKGSLYKSYDEEKVMEYMKGKSIEIEVDIGQGVKKFKSYTMDLTKKYIEINADYRT